MDRRYSFVKKKARKRSTLPGRGITKTASIQGGLRYQNRVDDVDRAILGPDVFDDDVRLVDSEHAMSANNLCLLMIGHGEGS